MKEGNYFSADGSPCHIDPFVVTVVANTSLGKHITNREIEVTREKVT